MYRTVWFTRFLTPSSMFPATVCYFNVDAGRLHLSRTETYYVVDTFLLYEHFPTITILGSTANIYSVTFTPATIRCSCSDSVSPCKHLLFIFDLLHLEPSLGRFQLDLSSCLSKIRRMRPFHTNRLDIRANQLCCNFLFKQCAFCIKPSFDSVLYVCNECDHLMHSYHTHEQMTACPSHCPLCRSLWTPYYSTTNGGYRNFSVLLRRLGYEVNLPSLQYGNYCQRIPRNHNVRTNSSSNVVPPYSP